MNQTEPKVIEYKPWYVMVLLTSVLVVVAIVAALFGGPWRSILGWAAVVPVVFFAYTCGKKAIDGFNDREYNKHYTTKKAARRMLYAIIGWSTATMLIILAGGFLQYLVDPW